MKKVDRELFISTYNEAVATGRSKEWISYELGMSLTHINSHCMYLRARGFDLGKFTNRKDKEFSPTESMIREDIGLSLIGSPPKTLSKKQRKLTFECFEPKISQNYSKLITKYSESQKRIAMRGNYK